MILLYALKFQSFSNLDDLLKFRLLKPNHYSLSRGIRGIIQNTVTMKALLRFILLNCLLFSFMQLNAQSIHLQEEQVPAKVKLGLDKKYPRAEDVIWSKEDNGLYAAQYWDADNDIYITAYFEDDGSWNKSMMEITQESFTEAMRKYFKTNYNEMLISTIIATQEAGGRYTYKIQIESEEKLITLHMDRYANVLSKSEEDISFGVKEDGEK
jgi:hypothetical protein